MVEGKDFEVIVTAVQGDTTYSHDERGNINGSLTVTSGRILGIRLKEKTLLHSQLIK